MGGGRGGITAATAADKWVDDAALPLENEDITKPIRREYMWAPPAFLRRHLISLLKNPLDIPMVYLQINIATLVVPSALLLFTIPGDGWLKIGLGFAHAFFTLFFFLQRFVLMLHFSEHRRLYRAPFGLLNNLNSIVFAPFFGVPSGMYYLHHVIMHHRENNIFPYDVSSTMPYQRDNFLHFLHYWARFLIASWVELPYYAFYRKRYGLAVFSIVCATGYWTAVVKLWDMDWVATCFAFVAPFCVVSLALMFGNWSQHIFVDPDRPESNFGLAYNVMNHPDNQRTFNDGYHINHHINAVLHWSQLPAKFMAELGRFAGEDAFLFSGVGFFDVGVLTMTGQLDKLARDHYVDYGQTERTHAEKVAELKRRLTPIPRDSSFDWDNR